MRRRTAEAAFLLVLGIAIVLLVGWFLWHLPELIGFLGSGL